MQIFYTDAKFAHILCQILRHTLGQCRDQHFMVIFRLFVNFPDQIIDLPLNRSHGNLWVQKSGRTDNLLHAQQFMLVLIDIRRS